ncbi:hypothetical protein [Deinococcus sp. 6GRE01]|uniref:hypothetical protein n=2 Tax=unclassified Deinococcus TaxID=2623546 RepID=UPI001E3A2BCA|nr:hypothetical protein [Deinococcus sp. 6GRE01]MCD0157041.1 hypothetical protein [Deinococcus sp. 6GRE01]
MKRGLKWMAGTVRLVDAQARWLLALFLLACGYAFAQPVVPDLGADPLGWLRMMAGNPVALGLVVFGLVETWKRNAARREPPLNWRPWRWWTLAFLIGMGGSVALSFAAGLLPGGVPLTLADLPTALLNGVLAGVVAIAGRDGARTVLGWIWPTGAAGSAAAQAGGTGLPAVQGEAEPAAPPASAFQALEAAQVPMGLMGNQHQLVTPERALVPAVLASLRQVLAESLPDELTAAQASELAVGLAPVIADLADGRAYLSAEDREQMLIVVQDALVGEA